MTVNTSGWTRRCAGCGLVRPFDKPDHNCPKPATLDTALALLMAASADKENA
jgi:hypothetical protein